MARLLPWFAALGVGVAVLGAVLAADSVDSDAATPSTEAPARAESRAMPGAGGATPAPAPEAARPPVPPQVGTAVPTRPARPGGATPAPPAPPSVRAGPGRVVPTEFVGPPIEGAGPVKEGTGWESSLAAREVAIVRAQIALNQEMTQVRELQAQVEDRWAESERARRFAEDACGASIVARLGDVGVLPPTIEDANERLDYVASLVKKMKPEQAAAMLQQWDDALAVRVLEAVSARAAAPIVSKMPPAVGGRLTRRMATGRPSATPGAAP